MSSSSHNIETLRFKVECPAHERTWTQIAQRIHALGHEGIPIRLIIIGADETSLTVEGSFIIGDRTPIWPSLISEPSASFERSFDPNVVISIIPTGVRAEIGGFAGDATPATNLLAATCDYLITNPNSVTASDLYFASDNVQYVEGNLICRFMLGQLDLHPIKQQSVGLVVEKPREERFLRNVQNAVNAMRTVAGIEVSPIVVTDEPINTRCTFSSEFGHASGEYDEMDALFAAMDIAMKDKNAAHAVGLITSLEVPDEVRNDYYDGKPIPNPWGSAEAILTHMTTSFYPITAAHSPLLLEFGHTMFGTLGDPRDGAELISSAFLCSMIRGLSQSPRVLKPGHSRPGALHRSDIRAIVMPESVVGNIPFFTAIEHGIPVILVRGNPTIFDMTPERVGLDLAGNNIHIVNSYMEAAGLLMALKEGINPFAIKRPVDLLELTMMAQEKLAT